MKLYTTPEDRQIATLTAEVSRLTGERDMANARLHEVAVACATAEEKLAASEERVGVLEKDAAIGQLVRKKLVSGNSIPVERCVIRADEVAAISGNKKECGDAAQILA